MTQSLAFEISPLDVESVLRMNAPRIVRSHVPSIHASADDLFEQLDEADFGRIERAALHAGVDLTEQTDAAYDELAHIFAERGWLTPVRGEQRENGQYE